MKNIKNYKLSEIDWKGNFENAKIYYTNLPNGCRCGCNGIYRYISKDEVLNWLGNNDFKIFNGDEAWEEGYKISKNKGQYFSHSIHINFGAIKTGYLSDSWKRRELIIELNNPFENCLK